MTMNCEWVKTNGALYLYHELPDDERHTLDLHLADCGECSRELEGLRVFLGLMTEGAPVAEPSPNLLASSRMKLQEALETADQRRGWLSRFTYDAAGWMQQMRFSPALSAVLLMIGFGTGALATYQVKGGQLPGITPNGAQNVSTASIAGIRGITADPNSNKVQINFDRLVPDQAQGSADDPEIRQLLLFAAQNKYNSGVRLDSINLLTRNPQDDNVREALIFAIRYDKNPGVRLKALDALAPFVKDDTRVRDAVLEALLRDTNPGVRIQALHALRPVTVDTSVRATLVALAERDDNKFIKAESRRLLSSLPEIE
jgi:hypothetical protein